MTPSIARPRRCAPRVGIVDASTLGKIDIQGPDTVKLLNMVYTNAFTKLEIGRCRYGLMCGEDGMVFDDGVTTRLGEHHFLMTHHHRQCRAGAGLARELAADANGRT